MRRKKSSLIIGGLIAAVLLILIAAVIIIIGKRSIDGYKAQIESLNAEIASNQRLVYVARGDIGKGEKITEENVMQTQIVSGVEQARYMTGDALGGTAIVSISANEPVMASMVTPIEITKDSRMYEITVAHLMTTQAENDVVDVRVLFPNGEDYLVLAKKTVQDLHIDTNVFTSMLNEDEILRIGSAIVDAYTTTGAKIYTTKYVESNLQEEAVPYYPVKASVIDLINKDPNIVEKAEQTLNLAARNDLDSRLGNLTKEQLDAVSDGLGLEDTAKSSVIRERVQNSVEAMDAENDNYESVISEEETDEETEEDNETAEKDDGEDSSTVNFD